MDQKSGYKKTKVGWIPEDWDFCKISDLTVEHKQGYYTKDEYSGNGRYLIRITDLKNPMVDFTAMPQLPIDEKTYQQFKVEPGDFLFARSGAIGRYGILDEEHPEAVFASYIIRFRFDENKVLNKYVGSFYESKFCLRQILSITQGSSNININANNIYKNVSAFLSSFFHLVYCWGYEKRYSIFIPRTLFCPPLEKCLCA